MGREDSSRHVESRGFRCAAALIYISCAIFAHHVALLRIQKFAELYPLQAESIGALPLPPSLWRWDGLVRTERGVYELRMDLADKPASDGELVALEHHYFPDAPANSYIEVAKRLPEVQKVLWFSRFPVTRFHKEGDVAVVEISDIRFVQTRRCRRRGDLRHSFCANASRPSRAFYLSGAV